jgi:hypothetical protein
MKILTKEEQLEHINDLGKNANCYMGFEIQNLIDQYKNSNENDFDMYQKIVTLMKEKEKFYINDLLNNKMKQDEYFAVMVDGKQTPSKLYKNDYDGAEKEASRLCSHTKMTTYVLKVVSKLELNEVKITRFE